MLRIVFGFSLAVVVFTGGILPLIDVAYTPETTVSTQVVAFAQDDTTYEFIQPLDFPGFGQDDGVVNITEQRLASFFNMLFQIIIGLIILLAIILVIGGGIIYMGSGSFTKKERAQKQIQRALGGLLLALSSVMILQTINPDLVSLRPLQGTFDDTGVVTSPDETGSYYCFDTDDGNVCADTLNECQTTLNSGDFDTNDPAECVLTVYYKSASTQQTSTGDPLSGSSRCVGYQSGGSSQVKCFSGSADTSALEVCQNFQGIRATNGADNPIATTCDAPKDFGLEDKQPNAVTYESAGELIDDSDDTVRASVTGTAKEKSSALAKRKAKINCKVKLGEAASETDFCEYNGYNDISRCSISGCNNAIQTGGGGNVQLNQVMQRNIINGNPSERNVRTQFSNANILINKKACSEVDPGGSCTNVGGLPQDTIDAVKNLKTDFYEITSCTSDNPDCKFEVTGGTSWWFHGDQDAEYNDNDGTYHNPTGINQPTGAVDLTDDNEKLNQYIKGRVGGLSGNDTCKNGNYYLREDDHWHIVFGKGCDN